jgi:O-antigen biosynthesis alpha-1,2-mannosyltransferase
LNWSSVLISNRVLKYFSDRLQRFPIVYNILVWILGANAFDASTHQYKGKSSDQNGELLVQKTYKLVFDAQCLQTPTRQRGIGKYSLNLILSICKASPDSRHLAVLTNVASSENLNLARADLAKLDCPNLDVVVIDIFESQKEVSFTEARTKILQYLDQHDILAVLSLSPFEKHESVISFPISTKFKNFAVLYDLIKLQFPSQLLISRKQKTSYFWSLQNLKGYDCLLSISEETKRNWIALTKNKTPIEVISGGGHTNVLGSHKVFKDRVGLLCVGAEQEHKNIERLIEAYCLLPLDVQLEHDLNISGVRNIGARNRFARSARKATGRVILNEYLSEIEMSCDYENARLLVMPSFSEGLSLPILEAWSHGLVAIGSINTVAEEIIQRESQLFNPSDPISMRDCIQRYLTSESAWNAALLDLESILMNFTWESTAGRALNAINKSWDK